MSLFGEIFDDALGIVDLPRKRDFKLPPLPEMPNLSDPEVISAGDAQRRRKKTQTRLSAGLLSQPTLGTQPLYPM